VLLDIIFVLLAGDLCLFDLMSIVEVGGDGSLLALSLGEQPSSSLSLKLAPSR
jgi:hypothetical protein